MKKLRYIIPVFAILFFNIIAMAQVPPPPGGGGAPGGGDTPVSIPLSSVALIVVGAGAALVAWSKGEK